MSESPISESPRTPPPIPKRAKAPGWFATLIVFCAIICVNVGCMAWWDYYCGLTWDIPPSPFFFLFLLIANVVFLLVWATTLHGGSLSTVSLVAAGLLSVCTMPYILGVYDPFLRGLASAVRRTDLEPLRKWAAAHRPPKGEFQTVDSIANSSIPEEVWRAIPFRGFKPFCKFIPSAEEDEWILKIDHSSNWGFHNGLILILGKDIDPSTIDLVHRARHVAPQVWVFMG